MYETKAKKMMRTRNTLDLKAQTSKKANYLLFKNECTKYKIAYEISENIGNEITRLNKIMISDIMEGLLK